MLLRFSSPKTPALSGLAAGNGFEDLYPAAATQMGPAYSGPAYLGPGGDKDKDDGRKGGTDSRHESGTATKTRPKTKRPALYRVLLLNDDYTPMEFVVLVLQDVFNKSRDEATRIMLHVHQKGVGECGTFPYEVAETKVTRVMDAARKNQHPLQCVMEKQ